MIRKLLYFIFAILSAILIFLTFDLLQHRQAQEARVQITGERTMEELRDEINVVLQSVMNAANDLVSEIENDVDLRTMDINAVLEKSTKSVPELLGVTISFEPYAYDESVRLFSRYYNRETRRVQNVEDFYDYTDDTLETTQWYVQPARNGATWVEPYFGQVSQALLTDYGLPFFYTAGRNKGKVMGTVSMTVSLSGFTELVHSLSLGKTGFGMVTSKKGAILAYPVSEYVGVKTIQDITETETIEPLKIAYQNIMNGEKGNVSFYDKEKQQNTLLFYDTVDAADWRIAVLFYAKDILGTDNSVKRKYIRISLTICLLCFVGITIFFNRDFLSVSEMWQLSFLASIILMGNLFLIGYLQHQDTYDQEKIDSPPITDNTQLGNFVLTHNENSSKIGIDPPIELPLGVYLERIEFADSYNLNLSGQVWMKYPKELPDDEDVGFRLPQTAPFAESSYIEEIYRKDTETVTLIVYEFRTTVRLNFDYSNYPFEKRHIALGFTLKNTDLNYLLVPDLKSYSYTNPTRKSGISEDIRIPGNEILESYFSYYAKSHHTSFGQSLAGSNGNYPTLNFNINIKRNLITSFVTYLIPILVTLTMMFILICATEKSKDSNTGGGIVQGLAAFFFVLIFSHIDLRKVLLTGELVYMEYFYFIAYFMIIICAFNLITYTRKNNRVFDYKNNIIIKTTFWPIFFFILLVMTLIKFY